MAKKNIIVKPLITEKTTKLAEDPNLNQYTFVVNKKANKVEIKKAIELIFNVKVLSVNTVNVLPKYKKMGKYEGFKPAYKKAVVKLAEGQKIDAFTV